LKKSPQQSEKILAGQYNVRVAQEGRIVMKL